MTAAKVEAAATATRSRWRKRKTKQYFPCRFMGGVPLVGDYTEKKSLKTNTFWVMWVSHKLGSFSGFQSVKKKGLLVASF